MLHATPGGPANLPLPALSRKSACSNDGYSYILFPMDADVLRLEELTSPELDGLDKDNTVFVMAMSPMEVHGPHLPLGTDVKIAEEIRDRAVSKIRARHPGLRFVILPSYYMGSDTIPGSVDVNSKALNLLLRATAEFLSDRGFRYLLVTDNHGGPRHQVALAKAAVRYYRRGFHIIAPFLSFFRKMVENDPDLLARIGAGPGECGDTDDSHAGLNETSLMRCVDPDSVRPEWRSLPRVQINRRRWPNLLLGTVGRALGALGFKSLSADVRYVALMLCWVTEKCPSTYIGEPCASTPNAGDRMLDAFSDEAVDAF